MSIVDELELGVFIKDWIKRVENQELDIVLDPLFDKVCDRATYEKNRFLMRWECAICGAEILVDRRRNDVDNFVCQRCGEVHNNGSVSIDKRILDSRTKMFKRMEVMIYDELESKLTSK